jgi:hypothetical protein
MLNWVKASTAWSASTPLATPWPTNLSVSHMLRAVLVAGSDALAALGVAFPGLADIGARSDKVFVLASLIAVGICAAAIVLWGRTLHPVVVGSMFLAVVSFTLPISYPYYTVMALPVFAVVFGFGTSQPPGRPERRSGTQALLVAALIVTVSPLVVPIASPVAGQPVPSLQSIAVPAAWLAFMVAAAVEAVRNRAQICSTVMPLGKGEPVDG